MVGETTKKLNEGRHYTPAEAQEKVPEQRMPLTPGQRAILDAIPVRPADEDPTPWCLHCGPKSACTCGQIAENN